MACRADAPLQVLSAQHQSGGVSTPLSLLSYPHFLPLFGCGQHVVGSGSDSENRTSREVHLYPCLYLYLCVHLWVQERSVSTILFLVSLQAITHCPFRVVDEINQGEETHGLIRCLRKEERKKGRGVEGVVEACRLEEGGAGLFLPF